MEMLECVLFIVFVIMLLIGVGYLSIKMTGIVNKKNNIRKDMKALMIDENIVPLFILLRVLFAIILAIIGYVYCVGFLYWINWLNC